MFSPPNVFIVNIGFAIKTLDFSPNLRGEISMLFINY